MKSERQLLAALAALLLAPLMRAASEDAPIVVRFSPPPTAVPIIIDSPPPIAVTIPRYALSPTERQTVAACLVLEAANQGDFGMRSVMAVIRNRARAQPELFAPTVLRAKQFSALNNLTSGRESLTRMIARAKRDAMWETALTIVDDALQETWQDPTDGATHYTRAGEHTRWTRSLAKTVTIGGHSFYR